jgi:hypothetical protein
LGVIGSKIIISHYIFHATKENFLAMKKPGERAVVVVAEKVPVCIAL